MNSGLRAVAATIGLAVSLLPALVGGACQHGDATGGGSLRVRNLVLVSLDTLRADRFGMRRGSEPLTPNLDAFATRAAHFTNSLSASAHTLASHKAMFSGRLPSAFLESFSRARKDGARVLKPIDYYRRAFRRWPSPPVAQELRNAGFATAAFTDGGYMDPRYGLADGFEPYFSQRVGLGRLRGLAQDWLQSAGSQPFFLFLHTYDVHCPYDPPARHLRLFSPRCTGRLRFETTCGDTYFNQLDLTEDERDHLARHYDAGVRQVDEELGHFLDWLESTGRLTDTAVIVTSDHGESLGERSFVGHGELYDNQLRVPLVVYVPGRPPALIDAPVSGVDVGPTILDLLVDRVPDGLDGVSLEGLLSGTRRGRAAFEGRVRVAEVAVGEGRFGETRLRKLALLGPDGMKLITDAADGSTELFDLSKDPTEVRNLFGSGRFHDMPLLGLARKAAVGPLRGVGRADGEPDDEGLSAEAQAALRELGYVE